MKAIITGSSGLVGSECVRHFDRLGFVVHGIDNNQRMEFFGPDGDTSKTLANLTETTRLIYHTTDIRNRKSIDFAFKSIRPDVVIHCAAQPSHDLATLRPLDDWDVNANGTLNLLEATRQHAPDAVFIFASTNKVYGDVPNRFKVIESEQRWDLQTLPEGFDECTTIDQSRHSLFGASKLAADVLVQEYGRTFGLKTGCFRCGCLTGSAHAAAEQHGFLAYIARCAKERRHYRIYGYKGKQVRDNLHAADVASAFELFAADPGIAEVYNLGGGKENSVSVIEAIGKIESATGKRMSVEYVDLPRGGDHVCYYSDTTKFRTDYPWSVTRNLDSIITELCEAQ